MLRIATAGNVDDGKSTLIGRLFHDTKALLEDQIDDLQRQAKKRSANTNRQIDLAAFTDGLKAEREQGITIDVAYRYFSTARRSFILADSPGHAQYTRNMVTGASTADCAIVLIDARHGVTTQTRRHAYIASLLGIRYLAVAVNKMDLIDFEQARFDTIVTDFSRFVAQLPRQGVKFAAFPISALDGDNVVTKSERVSWYQGPSLLAWLEDLPSAEVESFAPLRLPVQTVLHPDQSFRGFAGQIASGKITVGDSVEVFPSRKATQIARIVTFDGDLKQATAGQSVTVTFTQEIDVGRGDLIVHRGSAPHLSDQFKAQLVWMSESPLDTKKAYLIKLGTRTTKAWIETIEHRLNVDSLVTESTACLVLNEIGLVKLITAQPLAYDEYHVNRALGGFILIDPESNATVAAGMIAQPSQSQSTNRRSEILNSHAIKQTLSASESHARTVAKTASYRIFGSAFTAVLTYGMSGSISTAVSVGGFDAVGKLVLYYFHERIWNFVRFGRYRDECNGAIQKTWKFRTAAAGD